MHTADLLDYALAVAKELGYHVRMEWLDGGGGGHCEFGGKTWIFVDLALNTSEQLDQVVAALQANPRTAKLRLTPDFARLLGSRRAA